MSTRTQISTAITAHLTSNRKTGARMIALTMLLPNGASIQRRILRDSSVGEYCVQVHELLHRMGLAIIATTLHNKGTSEGFLFVVGPRPDDAMIDRFKKLHGLLELSKR